MRLASPAISALNLPKLGMLLLVFLTLASSACKGGGSTLPPSPTSLINGTRDRLNPFRFTLTTDPDSPSANSPVTLKVHIIDAANQPADDVDVQVDVSMAGMDQGAQHLTLSNVGGDYEGEVNLDMAGSWDVDMSASRDGKSSKQRLSIEVGG